MRTFVFPLAAGVALLFAGCTKDGPKKPIDAPKTATPVPSDMVFNDFVPPSGGGGIVGVKTDGGGLPEGGVAADSQATATAGGGEPPPAGADGRTKLTLIEAGAEPRAVRKYVFVVGKSDRRVLTIRQSAARQGGGPPQEQAFALTVDFTPKATKGAATKFDMKLLKIDLPDLPAAQKAQAQAQLGAFVGLSGGFDIDARGEIGEADFKADERMAGAGAEVIIQSLQQALELVVAPLPVEPIGVGAKWERKVESKARGQEQSATHSFTLVEASPDGAVVNVDVELSVPKHAVQARGVPPGATEEVKGKGKYTYALKFDRIATKVNGEMDVTRRLEIADGSGGPKQAVAETMKLKNQLDSVTGGAPAPNK